MECSLLSGEGLDFFASTSVEHALKREGISRKRATIEVLADVAASKETNNTIAMEVSIEGEPSVLSGSGDLLGCGDPMSHVESFSMLEAG